MLLKDFKFTGLDRAVGWMDGTTGIFDENRVDSKARAVLIHTGDDVSHRDGSLIGSFQEVTRGDSVRSYLVVRAAFALPLFEKGRARDDLGTRQRALLLVDVGTMDGVVF